MSKLRLLDLFCGAGGSAMGYYRAGLTDITGIDNAPQPRYPSRFIQADALEYARAHGHEYDLIHASPVCKGYSTITRTAGTQDRHPRMIAEVRDVLKMIGKPYIIENVPGAKHELINPVMLCGTMFDLLLLRHRYFETSPVLLWHPPACNHERKVVKHGRRPDRKHHYAAVTGHFSDVEFAQTAMGIDWMGQYELAQAIPPAYTEWIAGQLLSLMSVA